MEAVQNVVTDERATKGITTAARGQRCAVLLRVQNARRCTLLVAGWTTILAAITANIPGVNERAKGLQAGGGPAVTQDIRPTELSSRRKTKRRTFDRHRFRRGARGGGGRVEAGISPALRSLIADLRARHGVRSVRVVSGRAARPNRSCHPTGQAFDGNFSAAARRDVYTRHDLGIISYSGGMHHLHVSSCSREAGIRAHKRISRSNIFYRYATRRR